MTWMDKLSCVELRQRLRMWDIITLMLQNRLVWYDCKNDWLKRCMDHVCD